MDDIGWLGVRKGSIEHTGVLHREQGDRAQQKEYYWEVNLLKHQVGALIMLRYGIWNSRTTIIGKTFSTI